jgi:hypothetical protein
MKCVDNSRCAIDVDAVYRCAQPRHGSDVTQRPCSIVVLSQNPRMPLNDVRGSARNREVNKYKFRNAANDVKYPPPKSHLALAEWSACTATLFVLVCMHCHPLCFGQWIVLPYLRKFCSDLIFRCSKRKIRHCDEYEYTLQQVNCALRCQLFLVCGPVHV